MDPADVARFEAIAGDLLDELGYEVSTPEGREAVASSAAEAEAEAEADSGSGSGSGLGGSS